MSGSLPDRPRQRLVSPPSPTLALDFANTRCWRGLPEPAEALSDAGTLTGWLERAGVVDAGTAALLERWCAGDAGGAARLLADALHLRELVYDLFRGLADGATAQALPPAAPLAAWVAAAPARQQWLFEPGRRGWLVPMVGPTAAEVLAPVVWSAADLALAWPATRLRVCDNPQCRWLFVDDSKGGSRRWCSMSVCGNRAKARRHHLRHAASGGA